MSHKISVCVLSPVLPIEKAPGGGAKRFFQDFNNYVSKKINWNCNFIALRGEHTGSKIESISNPFRSIFMIPKICSRYSRAKLDLIYAQDSIYCGIPALISSRILHVPYVIHYHNSPLLIYISDPKRSIPHKFIFSKLINFIESLVLNYSRSIIVTNNYLASYLKDALKIRSDRIIVVPVGTDFHKNIINSSDLGLFEYPKDSFIFGYVGRLDSGKGLKVLLTSFSSVIEKLKSRDKIKLLIVGEGPERKALEDLSRMLDLENNIIFLGYRNDIPQILGSIDVFIYPSYAEGCPLSILEAMALAKPVISTNIPGVNEIIQHKHNGLLVGAGRAGELMDCMINLYSDKTLCMGLAKKAQETIFKKYDKENNLKFICRILEGSTNEL